MTSQDKPAVDVEALERLEERAAFCEERAENLRQGAGSLVLAYVDPHKGRMLRQVDELAKEAADLRTAIAMARRTAAAEGALTEVREACLYAEDDGSIGITQEPHIDDELFSRICALLTGAKS
jgi:hypothetical protein